ncbi:ORF6N domain-containing protein, partial [Arsenophonus nasoniae]
MKSELITIDSNQLPVIEWQNVRVVTTETLASGYGTEASNIRMNLSNNKSRFIEGIHYFNVTGEELAHLRVNNIYAQISNKARAITLYTEKGA